MKSKGVKMKKLLLLFMSFVFCNLILADVKDLSKLQKFTESIIQSLKINYEIEVQGRYPLFCANDLKVCQFHAYDRGNEEDLVQVEISDYGNFWNVHVFDDPRVSDDDYFVVCSAVMIVSLGYHKSRAERVMLSFFNYASKNGKGQWDIDGVEINVRVTKDFAYLCDFWSKRWKLHKW